MATGVSSEQASGSAFEIGDRVQYVGTEHWGLGIVANIKPDGVSVFFAADLTGMVWFDAEEAAAMLAVVARASYAPVDPASNALAQARCLLCGESTADHTDSNDEACGIDFLREPKADGSGLPRFTAIERKALQYAAMVAECDPAAMDWQKEPLRTMCTEAERQTVDRPHEVSAPAGS